MLPHPAPAAAPPGNTGSAGSFGPVDAAAENKTYVAAHRGQFDAELAAPSSGAYLPSALMSDVTLNTPMQPPSVVS